MTNKETAAWIRRWVASAAKGVFSWPTDACGYDQHIKFVEHRNKHWVGGDMDKFCLDYADALESRYEATKGKS